MDWIACTHGISWNYIKVDLKDLLNCIKPVLAESHVHIVLVSFHLQGARQNWSGRTALGCPTTMDDEVFQLYQWRVNKTGTLAPRLVPFLIPLENSKSYWYGNSDGNTKIADLSGRGIEDAIQWLGPKRCRSRVARRTGSGCRRMWRSSHQRGLRFHLASHLASDPRDLRLKKNAEWESWSLAMWVMRATQCRNMP